MKKILFMFLFCLFFATTVSATPWLVCDPQSGVTFYKVTGPNWVVSPITAQSDGSIRMDVSTSVIGDNVLNVSACKTDVVWGELCSDSVPFTFTRPGNPIVPATLGLVK